MLSVTKYLAAKHEKSTFSLSPFYANQSYSSYKPLLYLKEQLLPPAMHRLIATGHSGFISPNTIWASKQGLWLYDISENKLEYVSAITALAMVPFEAPILKNAVLMVTDRQSAIYGIENNTLVETPYRFALQGSFRTAMACGSRVFIGYDGCFEMLYFNGHRYVSSICRRIGSFMRWSTICVDRIAADSFYAVATQGNKFHIFSINNGIRYVHTEEVSNENAIINCNFIDTKEDKSVIYIMLADNTRIFYSITPQNTFFTRGAKVAKLFRKSGPFTGSTDPQSLLIADDKILFMRNKQFCLVNFNADQLVNPDTSRPAENFTICPVRFKMIKSAIFTPKSNKNSNNTNNINNINNLNSDLLFLSEHSVHHYKIIAGPDQLMNCRGDEYQQLARAYGDKGVSLCQLHLLAKGNKIGNIKAVNEDSLYLFLLSVIEPLAGDLSHKNVDFWLSVNAALNSLQNIFQATRSPEIHDVLQGLEYLKILNKFLPENLAGDAETILLGDPEFKKSSLQTLIDSNISPILDIVEQKCNGFFSLGSIYHRKGLEIISKGRKIGARGYLTESLPYFRRSDEDLTEIIRIYDSEKFYSGAAELLRKSQNIIFSSFNSHSHSDHDDKKVNNNNSYYNHNNNNGYYNDNKVNNNHNHNNHNNKGNNDNNNSYYDVNNNLIYESLGCIGAFIILIDDPRREFVYQVLEAAIQKIYKNDFSFLSSDCACCPINKGKESPDLKDFFAVDCPYMRDFLESKFSESNENYDLLWKFYLCKNQRREAQSALLRIADEKPLEICERYEYLNKALYVGDQPDEEIRRRVLLTRIQVELQERLPHLNLNDLLDEDEMFNRYTVPYCFHDLSLRIIDLTEFTDQALLYKIWSQFLTADLETARERLREINVAHTALDIQAIGRALLDIENIHDLHGILVDAGFSSLEIKIFLESYLQNSSDLLKRAYVESVLDKYYKDKVDGYVERVGRYDVY